MSLPIEYRVALGQEGSMSVLYKFGYQGSIGTTAISVWDVAAAYAYLASASVLTISSSDAKDASPAGVGALTVRVTGLDGDYAPLEEDVVLNGQTAVNTVGSFLRVFRMKVLTAGSELDNAGVIYAGTGAVSSGVPANKFAAISIGENQTLMAVYTVPAGKTLLLRQLNVTGDASKVVTARLVARELGSVFQVKDKFLIESGQTVFNHHLSAAFPAKTDIEVRAIVASGTTEIAASFEGLLYG